MNLKLFPLHTGVWEGTYTRLSPDGKVLDHHKSRLTLRLNGNCWEQLNEYFWDNGRYERHNFGKNYFNEAGIMTFDNDRIYGTSWESGDSIILEWTYKADPGSKLYEIINTIGPGHRMRVWQWSHSGRFEGLTMIEERQVSTQEQTDYDAIGQYNIPSEVREATVNA
ncbi:DUF3598 family protein [Rhodoflexus caldus]|uniref:DUF3598 family protein n=1 Tax=Rhodoflexus caldus TaxID=2891236 RepID=UPI002029FA74|nr:DUF3598 family protein [Rhodoflexus caldus]